jgi:hypothetical protein
MQEANPYAAPVVMDPNPMGTADDPDRLLGIAKAQRGLMLCILGYLVSLLLLFALGQMESPLIAVPGLLLLASSLGGLVFLIMLTYRLSGTVLAIVVGLCFLIPLVGLLLMVLMSGKASRILKKAGFKIGLLGADIGQMRQTIAASDFPRQT